MIYFKKFWSGLKVIAVVWLNLALEERVKANLICFLKDYDHIVTLRFFRTSVSLIPKYSPYEFLIWIYGTYYKSEKVRFFKTSFEDIVSLYIAMLGFFISIILSKFFKNVANIKCKCDSVKRISV